MKIAILAYEKANSLKRLIHSIEIGNHYSGNDIYIFLDKHPNDITHAAVCDAAESKLVSDVYIPEHRLGLRNNMLRVFHWCVQQNEPVLVLEDDLWLAPGAMQYAKSATSFYRNHPNIGMISLYHQPYVAGTEFPNLPMDDGFDNYFMQLASSSGFILFPEHAAPMLSYSDHEDAYISRNLPAYMHSWPLSSWKKIFNAWLLDSGHTVVYPRISYSTNFGEPGANHPKASNFFQSPLSMDIHPNLRFSAYEQATARYDHYMEWIPNAKFPEWEKVCFDLNGLKPATAIINQQVVTLRQTDDPLKTFGRALKPQELNIIYETTGNIYHLMDCQTFEYASIPPDSYENLIDYHYIFTSGRKIASYLKRKIFNS